MVSNVFPGHSFYHAGRYISKKSGAEILDFMGVRAYDYKLMAQDFLAQSALRPAKEMACFHAALSFYPGEKPSDETLTQIAREYLEALGITNTQYVVVKHTDKAHLHLHVMANMVNNDGKPIKDSWIGLRGKKVAQQLTRKYKLIPAEGKNLDKTHLEALGESEANRYRIYQAITACLPGCQSLPDLARQLIAQGIHTQFKYKGKTTELQGISFRLGQDCFKGSQIDRKYSLGNLVKALAANQRKQQTIPTASPDNRRKTTSVRQEQASSSTPETSPQLNISPMLKILMQHIHTGAGGGVPNELTDPFRKKKKKKRRGLG